MAKTSNNGLALCVIIIVVVGLFLHYEMGYNLDFFSVGGRNRHRKHDRHPYYGHRFKEAPWHYRFYHAMFPTEPHPQNITKYIDPLFKEYDLNGSGGIEKGEFSSALDGTLGSMINDKNKYIFSA